MAEVFFFLAAIGAIAGAIGTVSLRNPFYAVLALVCHLLALAARDPGGVVRTWNAEENRPMLSVNEALGFETICHGGVWQRKEPTA